MLRFRCLKGWVGIFPRLPMWKVLPDRLLIFSSYFTRRAHHARPLAKRFKKQIFLSVDVPPEVYSAGRGPAVLLEAEKGVVEQLRGL